MVFAGNARLAPGGFFELQVVTGVGWPARIPHLAVFSDIDLEPDETPETGTLYVRLVDPEGQEASRSEVKTRPIARRSFDGHGQIAHLAALPPRFDTRGVYVVELCLNGATVHSRTFQVGE